MAAGSGPFYYGWVIVAAFFLLNAAGQASGTLNFGLFVIPMAEELGLSRQAIGWAQTMRLWASGASGFLIGRWLDRRGPRGPMLLAIVAATGGLLLMARAQSAAVLFGVLLALGVTGWTAPAASGTRSCGSATRRNVPHVPSPSERDASSSAGSMSRMPARRTSTM